MQTRGSAVNLEQDQGDEELVELPGFPYPVEVPADPDLRKKSENGILLPDYERTITNELFSDWCIGKSLLLSDETVVTKFPVIGSFIDGIGRHFAAARPVLIICPMIFVERWIGELKRWAPSIIVECITEVKRGRSSAFDLTNDSFRVIIMEKEAFLKEAKNIAEFTFSCLIVDDLSVIKGSLTTIAQKLAFVRTLHTAVVSADYNNMTVEDLAVICRLVLHNGSVDPEFVTAKVLRGTLESHLITISLDAVIDSQFVWEKCVLCPMTQVQQKLYVKHFLENAENLEKQDPFFVQDFIVGLCEASNHPLLVSAKDEGNQELPFENGVLMAGKSVVLMKLVNMSETEGRRVVIVCDSVKQMDLVVSWLEERQVVHLRLNQGLRPKQVRKLLSQFNSAGFSVLVLPASMMDIALTYLQQAVIVIYGCEWSPAMNIAKLIELNSRCLLQESVIYQLVTKGSYEEVLFNDYGGVSILKEDDPFELWNSVRLAGKMAFGQIETVRGSSWAIKAIEDGSVVNFCERSAFHSEQEQFSDNFWRELLPAKAFPSGASLQAADYWTSDELLEYLAVLTDWGFGRWDKFSWFDRSKQEIMRIARAIIRNLSERSSVSCKYLNQVIKTMNMREPGRLENDISDALIVAMSSIDPNETLETLETLAMLQKVVPSDIESSQDISLVGVKLDPLTDDWTEDKDKELLFEVWTYGFTCLESEAEKKRVIDVLNSIMQYRASVRPRSTLITLKVPKRFTLDDHTRIISHLLSCGLQEMSVMVDAVAIPDESPEAVTRYVKEVLSCCEAAYEPQAKTGKSILVEKVTKYTAAKITKRIEYFDAVKRALANYEKYSAEELEFLRAMSVHGFNEYENSPVLTCLCHGNCSEAKLWKRTSTVMTEHQTSHINQFVPSDIEYRMPLRVNDMLIITSLGKIKEDESFHNQDFIYPVGYKCCCVCPSPTMLHTLIWIEGLITERDGKPWFVLRQLGNEMEFEYSGSDPDEPYRAVRSAIMSLCQRFIPMFDGHEMFGLTSGLFHRIVTYMPGFESCKSYIPRFFSTTFSFRSTWPTIGQFEKDARVSEYNPLNDLKFKKKAFMEVIPPLVLDFRSLFTGPETPVSIDVNTEDQQWSDTIKGYEMWF